MSDAVAQPVRAARRRRTRLFVLLGILVMLVAYTGCDLYAGRRLDDEIARLEPKYGVLRAITSAARREEIPAANNRARYARAAAALMIPPTSQALSGFSRFGTDIGSVTPELRAFVTDNPEAMSLAMKIVPHSPVRWETAGDEIPLLGLRNLSNLLSANAMLELESKQPDEAVRMVAAGLAVSTSLKHEPRLIDQLVRIAAADRQFAVIQQLIVRADPTKAALADLARALAENRETDPVQIGLRGELDDFNSKLTTLESGRRAGVAAIETAPGAGFLGRIGRPFLRMAHTRYLERMDRLLSSQAGPRPRTASVLPPVSWWSLLDRFVNIGFAGLERTIQTGDEFTANLEAAEIAVALRRYKLDHGEYPSDLSALTPTLLDRLPINPFTGKPPVYAREGAGFSLQSPRADVYSNNRRPLPEWKVGK